MNLLAGKTVLLTGGAGRWGASLSATLYGNSRRAYGSSTAKSPRCSTGTAGGIFSDFISGRDYA